ncbi:hypothetical protein AB4Z39_25565 [Mycobacterium adipatum]|uniref:hypothetical protein n=1 Tax=Mycobacterium adipatum TaxID=1682113 RepID=UPI0034E09577
MTRPNPDPYTPTTEETTRLRNGGRDALTPDEGEPDYELGRLSPARCVPTSRGHGAGMTANYATRWREGREAERQIDRLTEQARKRPRPQKRSGGELLPPLPDDTDLDWF